MNDHRCARWIVLFLALLAPLLNTAPASAAAWQPLPLWGGEAQLAAARGDSSVVYAATLAAGLYRSVDGGRTWQFVAQGPDRFRIRILEVDLRDPRRLYVVATDAVNYRGFFRSEDGGASWEPIDAEIDGFVLNAGLDPNGRLYAATSVGLYRSDDRGTTWARIAFAGERVLHVAVTSGESPVVLASVQTVDGGTIVRSTDDGATFSEVLDRPVRQFIFDPAHPARVFEIDFFGGLYRSDDRGATWASLPAPPTSLRALAITAAGTLLVGSDETGVTRSTDGGLTWAPVPGTPQARPYDAISTIVALPGGALAGGFRGVWKSATDGRGWRASSTGIRAQWVGALEVAPDDDSTLWVSTVGGLFTSHNDGRSYRSHLDGLGSDGFLVRLALDVQEPRTAYAFGRAGGEYGLLKTGDEGESWRLLPYDGVLQAVTVLAVDPKRSDFVYAGGLGEEHSSACTAERSTDAGESWTCMRPFPLADLNDLAISPRDPQVLYALFSGLLHRSADRGTSWVKISNQARAIDHLTVDPVRKDRLFALPQAGPWFLRSEDGGRTWKTVKAGLPTNSMVHDLLLDPKRPGRIWIAAEFFQLGTAPKSQGRVLRSDDAGRTWTEVSTGLAPGAVVLHLAADPREVDVLYAGTAGQGVYRLRVE